MKKELKANKQVEIKQPKYQKTTERKFAEAMQYMVDQITNRFNNQVIGGLQKSTIEKFEDAQIGNFASVFLNLSKKAKRKLLKQFDDDRIEDMVSDLLSKDSRKASDELYSQIEKKIGINAVSLKSTEGLSANMNALIAETSQWAKKLRDETIANYTNDTLRNMAQGKPLDDIIDNFRGMEEKRKNHSKMVARTQISTFNSLSSKVRAQNLGITKGIWVTARDERVRSCHKDRDGKEFDLSEGLYSSCDNKTLLPGVDYNCRCTTKYIIPGEEDE